MIRIAKFQMDHLTKFDCTDDIPDLTGSMAANMMNPQMDIVSLIDDNGDTVALAGVNHLRVGVGEVWIIRGSLIESNKLQFYKSIKGLIAYITNHMCIHRLELAVLKSWEGGHKWATSIGFKFESLAEAYDMFFNDHAIYVKIDKGDKIWP